MRENIILRDNIVIRSIYQDNRIILMKIFPRSMVKVNR